MNGNTERQKVLLGLNKGQLAILAAGVAVVVGLAIYFTGVSARKEFYTDEGYFSALYPEPGVVTLANENPPPGQLTAATVLGEFQSEARFNPNTEQYVADVRFFFK